MSTVIDMKKYRRIKEFEGVIDMCRLTETLARAEPDPRLRRQKLVRAKVIKLRAQRLINALREG